MFSNNEAIKVLKIFENFGPARNHGKKFPNLSQTSFSGIVNSEGLDNDCSIKLIVCKYQASRGK